MRRRPRGERELRRSEYPERSVVALSGQTHSAVASPPPPQQPVLFTSSILHAVWWLYRRFPGRPLPSCRPGANRARPIGSAWSAWATSAGRRWPRRCSRRARRRWPGRQVVVDSAGTGDWHIGQPMDASARARAARGGYDGSAPGPGRSRPPGWHSATWSWRWTRATSRTCGGWPVPRAATGSGCSARWAAQRSRRRGHPRPVGRQRGRFRPRARLAQRAAPVIAGGLARLLNPSRDPFRRAPASQLARQLARQTGLAVRAARIASSSTATSTSCSRSRAGGARSPRWRPRPMWC